MAFRHKPLSEARNAALRPGIRPLRAFCLDVRPRGGAKVGPGAEIRGGLRGQDKGTWHPVRPGRGVLSVCTVAQLSVDRHPGFRGMVPCPPGSALQMLAIWWHFGTGREWSGRIEGGCWREMRFVNFAGTEGKLARNSSVNFKPSDPFYHLEKAGRNDIRCGRSLKNGPLRPGADRILKYTFLFLASFFTPFRLLPCPGRLAIGTTPACRDRGRTQRLKDALTSCGATQRGNPASPRPSLERAGWRRRRFVLCWYYLVIPGGISCLHPILSR